jgi:hypothetical protein
MKSYQPSKYGKLVFKYFGNENIKIILPLLFIGILFTMFLDTSIMAIFGAVFVLIIFLRISVNVIENKRIEKYCKENSITTDEFNILNSNK